MYYKEPFVDNPLETGETIFKETYDTTVTSLNTAFGLATALAWTEAIKSVIENVMPKGSGHYQLVYYALFVSVFYTLFIMLTNKKRSDPNATIVKLA